MLSLVGGKTMHISMLPESINSSGKSLLHKKKLAQNQNFNFPSNPTKLIMK